MPTSAQAHERRHAEHDGSGPLRHDALLYGDVDEYASVVGGFVRDGLALGEPVLVSAPPDRLTLLRHELGPDADGVEFADMTNVGRNPARIIPFVRNWSERQQAGRRRFVGEPIWPGRRHDEAVEGWRHEGLLNLAFAHTPVHILCPYDASRLRPEILLGAHETHPALLCGGDRIHSDVYTDPRTVYRAAAAPLPPAPDDATSLEITTELADVRAFVVDRARREGLDGRRLADLLIAANEAVTNTLAHGDMPGRVRTWVDESLFFCEVADRGHIDDPLIGRRQPDRDSDHGRGVWLINQMCDLVQLRSRPGETTVRLAMRLA